MNFHGIRHFVWTFLSLTCLWTSPVAGQVAPVGSALALRAGALASTELDLVGLTLNLPASVPQLPQNSPFYLPVSLLFGGQPATQAQQSSLVPDSALLQGTLTGPGLSAPVPLTGTLAQGLSVPGLPQAGNYTISGVQLVQSSTGPVILSATPATYQVTCLGQILLSSVSSSPMTLQQLQAAGIQLAPGDYVGKNFTMALTIGGSQVSLSVPVAIPVYNGLVSPNGAGQAMPLQIGNIVTNGTVPGGLSVVAANLTPPSDPFSLSRPALSFKLNNNFKALLVVPGSIGYLKQVYNVNVVVFNTLDADSPYQVTNLTAQWVPPVGPDGLSNQLSDPLMGTAGESLTQPLLATGTSGSGQGANTIQGGQSAMATFSVVGNLEGSHPLDFLISGEFQGGDLTEPVAISGTAEGKVLVVNPTFNLMLVHPDVIRRGQTYTLEAHLTNTSQTIANAVSITLDKSKMSGAVLVGDATQQVDTLLPGATAVMKFQLTALLSGKVTSSYLYLSQGTIGYQLSTGIGPRDVELNPDTLALPDTLSDLPPALDAAMLAVLDDAYDVATAQGVLPAGVLPIQRGTITTGMAQVLSQEGLFLGMGLDRTRIWWDLWQQFTANTDTGFDQLMRTTTQGAQLRTAFLDAWPDPNRGPVDLLASLGSFGYGAGGTALVAVQGAEPGLGLSLTDDQQNSAQSGTPPTLTTPGAAWAQSSNGNLQFAQLPLQSDGVGHLTLSSPTAQTIRVAILSPVPGQDPVLSSFDLDLDAGGSCSFALGGVNVRGSVAGVALQPSNSQTVPAEPFQVVGVHRYDLSVAGAADPYGTQVLVLFNRPNQPLQIPAGPAGFSAASALVQVEANQFWQKVMVAETNDDGTPVTDNAGNPVVAPSPAALIQTYPRVVSCYLEKPVGPYVPRLLTLSSGWSDAGGNTLQGPLSWPIASGMLPGGAIVKGHFRKLDGTGVPGTLTYWYQQGVNNASIDLLTGYSFLDEEIQMYYALVTNNVATDPDGAYQLDYVPAPVGDYVGPFVLQGGFPGGTAFAEASVQGNGQVVQMDLVLEGSGSVDGFVLDAAGIGVPGVTVRANQQQQSSNFTAGTGGGAFSVTGSTDATGHYHLDGLKTGIFSLQALKGVFGVVGGGEIDQDGQVVSLNLVLQGQVGTVKAHVLDPKGNVRLDQTVLLGIPAGLVRTAGSAGAWVYPEQALPGPDGWATFTNVPAGDIQVIAPYASPTPAPAYIGFLNPGATLQAELQMLPQTQLATVQAQVNDASGNPVAGAYLKFDANTWTPYLAQTQANGLTPPVQVVPGGSLTGYIFDPNWVGLTPTNTISPQPGGSYVLTVTLPPRCALSGTVTRPDGTPVAGAYVAIPPVSSNLNQDRLCITNAQGGYTLPNVPVGTAFRLAAVGPELLTSVSVAVAPAAANSALVLNLQLPAVGHNTITGTVFQPMTGAQNIPTNATLNVTGQLPNVDTGDGDGYANGGWGLLQTVTTGGVAETDMLPSNPGQFSLGNLPAGNYTLTASSSMFPNLVTVTGTFGAQTAATVTQNIHLQGSNAASLKGTVVQSDGQTPVSPGARVLLDTDAAGSSSLQVLTQAGGTYSFAQVIPPGSYYLRVEDPVSGNIVVQQVSFAPLEIKAVPLRLWGTGTLTVLAQDSNGNPLQNGTVTLQDSKSNLTEPTDMPILALPLTPANNGTLAFPQLLEGPVSVLLRDPNGFSGTASATLPVGGGDQTVTVTLQPVGAIKGTLVRADGTPVPAGRVDAYQNGQWLGVSPTYQENTPGEFLFNPMPTGAITLEAWDPDSRQTGQATVVVQANTTTTLTLQALDTGPVTIQVLAADTAQPVLRAGINVAYRGGPALNFSTQATADATGTATFTLPPGTYGVQATDPVSLACGSLSFTRGLNDPALSYTLTLAPVTSVLVTALPPNGAPGLSLTGWRVTAGGLDRSVVLDTHNTGILQEMPVGAYTLYLADATGASRGSAAFQVMASGGALQDAQIQATAIGSVQVTVTDANGNPVTGASCSVQAPGVVNGITTNAAGQADFTGVPQGTWPVSASLGLQQAHGACTVTSQGQMATASVSFAPTAGLHGIVRDSLGHPQPFLSVSCGTSVPATATDGNGAYAFTLLPLGSYTVTATTAQGRTGSASATLATELDNPEVDITLQPMGALDGILADPLRPSLPSLAVQVLSGSTLIANSTSDQTGAFHFPLLPAVQNLTLRVVWDDGSTVALEQSFTIPGEGQDLVLNLQILPFVDVNGWTLDASGANTPMYVQLKNAQGLVLGQASTSSDLPTYFFHYLRAGQAFQLEGFDPYSHAPLALTPFTPVGQTALEIHSLQMAPQPPVVLQLRYPDGSPAPGGSATALVTGTGGLTSGLSWNLTFNAAGTATLAAVPSGTIHVVVSGLPWQAALAQDATIPAQSAEFDLGLPVLGLATLDLQLTYPDGSAAPGTGVTASLAGLPGGAGAGGSAFNAAGHLTWSGLPLGSGLVQILGLPWQSVLTVPFTLATQGQDLVLAATIEGLATLDLQLTYPDGSLAPGTGVTANISGLPKGAGGTGNGFNTGGHLTLPGLPLGSGSVQVLGLPWQSSVSLPFTLANQGQDLSLPVPVEAAAALSLRLHTNLAPGHDVTQASVTLLRQGKSYPLTLQADGSFQALVPVGEALDIQIGNYVTGKVMSQIFGALSLGTPITQDTFLVPALGQIHGYVYSGDGTPRANWTVQLTDGGQVVQTVQSSGSGQFQFPGVEVGQPVTLSVQDPVLRPVSATVALAAEGQDLAQNLQFPLPGTVNASAVHVDGSMDPGLAITVTGAGPILTVITDGNGQASFPNLPSGVTLTLTAPFPTGTVTASVNLQPGQTLTQVLKETPRTHLAGVIQRQGAGQTWPAGTSLVVEGAAYANIPLNPDGTFQDQDLLLNTSNYFQLYIEVPGFPLTIPGTVTVQVGGTTTLNVTAPGFGSVQGSVTLAGAPVVRAQVRLDNQYLTTDTQGLTPSTFVLLGAHMFQVTATGGMAWADLTVATDGQSQVIALPLQSNAVSLPASITLGRLGLSVNPLNCNWIPPLSVGTETTALAALVTPPQGYWLVPGSSFAYETDQGDIHVTRILTSVGYGVRDQLVFQNRGTVAHALSLGAETGSLQSGQDLNAGGAWFEGCTVAWGLGAWVPTHMGSSYPNDSYYSYLTNELQWPALALAPGQTYSIWLGYAPHGQNYVTLPSSVSGQTLAVASTQRAATRALQRMVGQAPEWIQALDPRLSNGDPAPTVTDTLPAWNGSASLSLLDPTGEPVQALGISAPTLVFTPIEALAPVTTWNLQPGSGGLFSGTIQQVPPDGLGYVLKAPSPIQGDLASGQTLDLQLGPDWAVFQFNSAPGQNGNHWVRVGDGSLWSSSETLVAGTGLRWSTPSQSITWNAQEQDNSNIQATGSQPLAAGTFNPVQIRFPAFGSVQVLGPSGLAYSWLKVTDGNGNVLSVWYSGAGWFFPAVPVGPVQVQGEWNLGTVQVQEGVTTTLTVATGAVQVTGLDGNGALLSTMTVFLTKDGISNSFYCNNPGTMAHLPVGTYTVALQDPDSRALVSTSATVTDGGVTPVTLRLSLDGSLWVSIMDASGALLYGEAVTTTPTSGVTQYQATAAVNGLHPGVAQFTKLGTGTASVTYGSVPNAYSSDQPGSLPTLVPLVPGSTVSITLRVPALGTVNVTGVAADGMALTGTGSYSYYTNTYVSNFSMPNAFVPGRRMGTTNWYGYTSWFQGVPLNQPLVVRFGGSGTSYLPVDAPAFTPTADGQTVNLTFPMAHLVVSAAYSDQVPIINTQVALNVPGASAPMTATTDGTGLATFNFVPYGPVSASLTTKAGAVVVATNVPFNTPGQVVALVAPAPAAQINVHVARVNPQATLWCDPLVWAITPGSNGPLPTGGPDVTFTDLVPGTPQTVSASFTMVDNLNYSYALNYQYSGYYQWAASATVTTGTSPTSTTLTLPVRASAALVMQDALGNLLTGPIPHDTLTLNVKQSTNPFLVGSTRTITSFDGVVLPEVFTQGTHVLGVTSSLWGPLPDLTFSVGAGDDGNQIQLPVTLNWLATPFALQAVASDGATPVPYADFSIANTGLYLGTLGRFESWVYDTDTVSGILYLPPTAQAQFSAHFAGSQTPAVSGALHSAGAAISESIMLPLTVVRARLTDTDGTDLGPFGVERASGVDQPLPLVQVQGTLYAVLLGDAPGTESLTFYDLSSGLGQIAPVTVPPLGQTGSALVTLPPNAWSDLGSYTDVYGSQQSGPFMMALGADAPGLVKPSLAQWCYDPAIQWAWVPMASWYFAATGTISYPYGATLSAGGFMPATNWNSAGNNMACNVRIPLQGTLWMATCTEDGNGNYMWGNSFASLAYSAIIQGQTLEPVFQEPSRTWVDLLLQVQDGNGNPYATGVTAQPAHAPYGWYYNNSTPYTFDGTNPVDFNLDQGETVHFQTCPPDWWTYGQGCGIWWSGFLDLVVPDTPPATPLVLPASTNLSVVCPPS